MIKRSRIGVATIVYLAAKHGRDREYTTRVYWNDLMGADEEVELLLVCDPETGCEFHERMTDDIRDGAILELHTRQRR